MKIVCFVMCVFVCARECKRELVGTSFIPLPRFDVAILLEMWHYFKSCIRGTCTISNFVKGSLGVDFLRYWRMVEGLKEFH